MALSFEMSHDDDATSIRVDYVKTKMELGSKIDGVQGKQRYHTG